MDDLQNQPALTLESLLTVAIFGLVGVLVTDFPVQYPTDLELLGVIVYPELFISTLLAVVVLRRVIAAGIQLESVISGVLAVVTAFIALVSLYALYSGTASGSFGGGVLTLMVSVPLATVVLLRTVAGQVNTSSIRTRLGV